MKRCAAFVVLMAVFALAQAAPAPETYTVKIKERAEGESVVVEKVETKKTKSKIMDGQGTVQDEQTESIIETMTYKETVLKRDGTKPPTKLERAYTKSEVKTNDKTEDLDLAGKTVVIEKKDDKYTFTFKDGGEVQGAAQGSLAKEFSVNREVNHEADKAMLPTAAVKPGQEWKIDMKPIIKALDPDGKMEVAEAKVSGTGKLLKAYKKDGKQFGEMQIKLVVPVKSISKELKFTEPMNMLINVTMDMCIDGTSEAGSSRMTVEGSGVITLPNPPGGTLALTNTIESKETVKEPAKK